ncbi:MAG: SNF2-related protein [Gammaproteobacteria bacterium]
MSLSDFIGQFNQGLVEAVSQKNPPLYDGKPDLVREKVMDGLLRHPFPSQRGRVQAITRLLVDEGDKACILNAEMGTGKTMMAISASAVMQAEGYQRFLIIVPPHLCYKWRREILETVPDAKVWVLNGPDTLMKLLKLRESLGVASNQGGPEYFILGRVRMRMGFHWSAVTWSRKRHRSVVPEYPQKPYAESFAYCACPHCGSIVRDSEGDPITEGAFSEESSKQTSCAKCEEPLWSLHHARTRKKTRREMIAQGLCQIPTIGVKTAEKLLSTFGEETIEGMLADNIYEFINLMDEKGELVFSDRQANRMEHAMGKLEFSFGQGGYQPTEFIKRYLPNQYFDMLIVDEGHEYKNDGSAQGQAMGVLCNKVRKSLLLTGTLIGGYADDLFYLLWRLMPKAMIEDGFAYNEAGTLGTASMAFMREHGVLKDVFKETVGESHKTAKGKKMTVRTSKAPGFGPKGIARYVLPYTVFLKLKDIGGNVLPPYNEHYLEVPMTGVQAEKYRSLSGKLTTELRQALACGDTTLLGVVLNALLAWPDCCFREEVVRHPRKKELLAYVASVFSADKPSPKESALLQLCKEQMGQGRRVLVYTTYTGKRDTASRLKSLLQAEGIKVAVLRSSVETGRREDWILDQVDRGIQVMICNPELVKTGLDLLEFPTIVFMQTGYNVYTLMQASRRSWRIGQKEPVDVHFFGYEGTAQTDCLQLMAKKIAVTQSTSGDMPETGLDSLNQDGDSIEVALAKRLIAV